MKTATSIAILSMTLLYLSANAAADSFGSGDNIFNIEFVTIGNPGNPADTTGDPNPAGSVDYLYRIGKFQISRDMVTKANADGGLGLPLHPMNFVTGGPRPDMPATGISWNHAARFVNWLNTSQGFSPAIKFSTQPGDVGYDPNANLVLWEAGDPGFDESNRFRNRLAHYFLPSVHEWYKAAYFDPSSGEYFDYSTGSNAVPQPVASGTDQSTAVYRQSLAQGPADISLAGGLSPYGTMSQGSNVWEWVETEFDLLNDSTRRLRGVRNGRWVSDSAKSSSEPIAHFPSFANEYNGFRVASIAPLAGDFNGDGVVTAADYTVWRDGLGTTFGPADYDLWKADFASPTSSSASAENTTVPEPTTDLLLLILAPVAVYLRSRPAAW